MLTKASLPPNIIHTELVVEFFPLCFIVECFPTRYVCEGLFLNVFPLGLLWKVSHKLSWTDLRLCFTRNLEYFALFVILFCWATWPPFPLAPSEMN